MSQPQSEIIVAAARRCFAHEGYGKMKAELNGLLALAFAGLMR